MDLGTAPPELRLPVPGDAGTEWVERLAKSECPAFTARRRRRTERSGTPHDPIVWIEAKGVNVIDADGNRYVDLTSGFGVAFVGHRHPAVVGAIQAQTDRLLHALGDLYPSDVKVELLERLRSLAPWPDARGLLSLSGSDAIATALKTAVLATGKPGVVAFEGSYHGLAYGPLAVSGYSARLRDPFVAQLNPHVQFAPWPAADTPMAEAISGLPSDWGDVGALILEPVQGRGGVRVPPPGFLEAIERVCRREGVVLIVDEVFTGIGRTGSWWSSVAQGCTPDLLCIGKALGGGLPISACLGSATLMSAWGQPDREAIHTGTFYGSPLGCAAALATLGLIEREGLMERAANQGKRHLRALKQAGLRRVVEIRQAGLMLGVQLDQEGAALPATRSLLERGYLVLPAGAKADVIQVIPPVVLDDRLFDGFVLALQEALEKLR